ncbi:MAG TPA: HlyD family efflux transporter periplasmic adaptor subunit, partial [Isosphaeraceae bacterium]|nr:HlyD family efflux transporter periplasmic adaptor subunit [Isosphaeraceae bacterium]
AELDAEDRLVAARRKLEREKAALEGLNSKQGVLEKYTSKKTVGQLNAEIEHKRQAEAATFAAWRIENGKETSLREKAEIPAPFDGRIVLAMDLNGDTGDAQVKAGSSLDSGQEIFSVIGKDARIRVRAKVDGSLVPRVKPGQRAEIRVQDFKGWVFTGAVQAVASSPDPHSGSTPKLHTVVVEFDSNLPKLPGFDLQLMSPRTDVNGLPKKPNQLITVSAVGRVLHFRIFDDAGKVVRTDETELKEQAPQPKALEEELKALRALLESLWRRRELTASEKGQAITAVASIVGHAQLRPDMTADVKIFVTGLHNVVSVPAKAVLTFDSKDHVAVRNSAGGFDWREVIIGQSSEEFVQIEQGLESGEVVLHDALALVRAVLPF